MPLFPTAADRAATPAPGHDEPETCMCQKCIIEVLIIMQLNLGRYATKLPLVSTRKRAQVVVVETRERVRAANRQRSFSQSWGRNHGGLLDGKSCSCQEDRGSPFVCPYRCNKQDTFMGASTLEKH